MLVRLCSFYPHSSLGNHRGFGRNQHGPDMAPLIVWRMLVKAMGANR